MTNYTNRDWLKSMIDNMELKTEEEAYDEFEYDTSEQDAYDSEENWKGWEKLADNYQPSLEEEIIEDSFFYEPSELTEWQDYDPDC